MVSKYPAINDLVAEASGSMTHDIKFGQLWLAESWDGSVKSLVVILSGPQKNSEGMVRVAPVCFDTPIGLVCDDEFVLKHSLELRDAEGILNTQQVKCVIETWHHLLLKVRSLKKSYGTIADWQDLVDLLAVDPEEPPARVLDWRKDREIKLTRLSAGSSEL